MGTPCAQCAQPTREGARVCTQCGAPIARGRRRISEGPAAASKTMLGFSSPLAPPVSQQQRSVAQPSAQAAQQPGPMAQRRCLALRRLPSCARRCSKPSRPYSNPNRKPSHPRRKPADGDRRCSASRCRGSRPLRHLLRRPSLRSSASGRGRSSASPCRVSRHSIRLAARAPSMLQPEPRPQPAPLPPIVPAPAPPDVARGRARPRPCDHPRGAKAFPLAIVAAMVGGLLLGGRPRAPASSPGPRPPHQRHGQGIDLEGKEQLHLVCETLRRRNDRRAANGVNATFKTKDGGPRPCRRRWPSGTTPSRLPLTDPGLAMTRRSQARAASRVSHPRRCRRRERKTPPVLKVQESRRSLGRWSPVDGKPVTLDANGQARR